ncbi:MAG: shikimate dehydrogenase [Acidimicrobiales bacterium]
MPETAQPTKIDSVSQERGPGPATRVVGVIGSPVRHSLSPVIHNAAFRALGLDWVYLAFEVAPGAGGAAVEAVRGLGLEGLNVTRPHKDVAAAAVDRLSPVAARLGAVNTVVRDGAVLVGDNTDGAGFIDALAAGHDFRPADRHCVVLGGGGAARAVALALGEAGAAGVVVVARRPAQAEVAARMGGAAGRAGTAADVEGADLVVNATPVTDRLPLDLDPAHLVAGQLVVELSYQPPVSALLAAARSRGAVTANGVGMLVHQAARSFEMWTGREAPLAAMRQAVAAELAGR